MRHHFTIARMAIIKKTGNSKCWRGYGEPEPSYPAGGNVKWYGSFGEKSGGSSNSEAWHYRSLLQGVYPTEVKTYVYTKSGTWMLTATLFTTAKGWEQPGCPSTEEQIKYSPSQDGVIQVQEGMKYSDGCNTDEAQENTVKEVSPQRPHIVPSIYMECSEIANCGCLQLLGGNIGWLATGYEVSFGGDENVLKLWG